MVRHLAWVLALGLTGCGGCGKTQMAPQQAPVADAAVLAEAGVDASTTPELLPASGRVFFGKAKRQDEGIAMRELFVVREGASFHILLDDEEMTATAIATDAGAGELSLSAKSTLGALLATIHDDGSFEGSLTYEDNSKTEWERIPYVPLTAAQLASVPLEGFLSKTTRYRMKLAANGGQVEGVARYAPTRAELRLRGTVDAVTRRLVVDELGPDDKVTGHIDAIVLGHIRPKGYASFVTLLGTWSSPDGARKLRLLLRDGFYPDRIGVPGGIFLSAQERYSDECGVIDERIFPVLDNAPKDVTKRFNDALGTLIEDNGGERVEGPPDPKSMLPMSKVRDCAPDPNIENHSHDSARYVASKLQGTSVALEVEHYSQSGSISGRRWADCLVADLATAAIVPTATLLDPATRAKFATRARAEAIATIDDAGTEQERSAASGLDITQLTPLCITDKEVRFAVGGHPVWGPADPTYDRAEFVKQLPAGKLRTLLGSE